MKIVLIGSVRFSMHCLREILGHRGEVVGIFTLPGREGTINHDYVDLAPFARRHRIPVYHVCDVNAPDCMSQVRKLQADVIFCFGFSKILGREILMMPPKGCIGSHPSLLPENRGRHPLIWPLISGAKKSGLSFYYMTEEVDAGDILWQEAFPILLEDDAADLYGKIEALATKAIPFILEELQRENPRRIPQDHAKATYCRKRTEADGLIPWHSDSMKIYNLIRALTRPYPGAHTFACRSRLIAWQSRFVRDAGMEALSRGRRPGEIVAVGAGDLVVKTGDGLLRLTDWHMDPEYDLQRGVLLSDKETSR